MRPRAGVSLIAIAAIIGCGDSTGPGEGAGATVRVSPRAYTLFADDPVRLLADVSDAEGAPLSGSRVKWTSRDSSIVTVDSLGIIRGVSLGFTIIRATLANGRVDSAFITVSGFTSVSAGTTHTCATTSNGQSWCWGNNTQGQLGDSTFDSRLVPTRVATPFQFDSIAAGFRQTCALTAQGAEFCWGRDVRLLGAESTALDTPSPSAVTGGQTFLMLSLGDQGSCALMLGGSAVCRGAFTPTGVPAGFTFGHVSRGATRACGVTTAKAVHCWGTDVYGTSAQTSALLSDAQPFAAVAVGESITCALTEQGAAYCWRYGQPGPGAVAVAGALAFQSLDAEKGTACGVATSGVAYCWGANGRGQLGDGTTTASFDPSRVAGGLSFQSVSVGDSHACGLTRPGAIYCWGANDHGQLGDGTQVSSLVPVRARSPQ